MRPADSRSVIERPERSAADCGRGRAHFPDLLHLRLSLSNSVTARNMPSFRNPAIWVAAYLRRCQTEGIFGAVRRRGAEEAGAVFVKIGLLDGNAMLYAPAPQTVYDESRPVERHVRADLAATAAGSCGRRAAGEGIAVRSRCLDCRDRGQSRAAFSRSGAELDPNSASRVLRRACVATMLEPGCTAGRVCAGAERARWRSSSYSEGRYLARVTASVEPRHAASMISAERSLRRSYSRDSR